MKKDQIFGKTIQAVFVLGIVLATYFAVTQAPLMPVMKDGKIIGWRNLDLTALAGYADPDPGKSGFLKILIYKHHPATGYYNQANMSINTSCYGNTFDNNSHNMSSIPYSTAFDIVVEFRWNSTHANSTSNNTWMLQWVRMNITCPELGIAAGTAMDKYNLTLSGMGANTRYMWVHFIANNGGAGYTLTKGQNVSHCYFQPSAYY